MKELHEQIFPVENYTDKIHTAVGYRFNEQKLMTFTVDQMVQSISSGYPWLKNLTARQTTLLKQIVKTGISKLVQKNNVKKVHSAMTVDAQYQSTIGLLQNEGFVNVTSEDSVAHTPEAEKAIGRRAIGGQTLFRLNNVKPKLV